MSWTRDPHRVDVVVAALFMAALVVDVLVNPAAEGPAWANVLGAAAIAAALLARRRAPVPGALAFYALLLVFALWLSPPPQLAVPFFGLLFFPYAVAVHGGARAAAVVLGGLPLTVVAVHLITGEPNPVAAALFPTAVGAAAYIVGRAVRSRLELAAELHEAAVLAEEEDEAEAARAVLEERARISREMHDVVAHSISVMVVQAGGARRILEADPARAVDAAAEIERVGRDALLEMRRLLGALHPGDDAPRAPQPGLDGLGALIDRARAAGLPVELHEEGARPPLSPGVDLALYRIVQEALTNSLKHSGPARTDVRLHWSADAVELEVCDLGAGGDGCAGEGRGLVGMRERVRLYGGELVAGARDGGGYRVRARIPFKEMEHA